MRMSRYLEAKAFLDEAKKLKATTSFLNPSILERLESQRSLIPILRLRYPDPIERRWFAKGHRGKVNGPKEPDGPRWRAAMALEKARQEFGRSYDADPTKLLDPLAKPEARFRQFIQRPERRRFVPWADYRVEVGNDKAALYTSDTVVTYYSSWQLLLFAEVVNMGVLHLLNLEETGAYPSQEVIAAAPGITYFEPLHALRDFREHRRALDAIVWYAEESTRGYMHATRTEVGRRMLDDAERDEIMRTRLWAASEARRRHKVSRRALVACIRMLAGRWAHWNDEGRPLIAGAYKSFLKHAVGLTCLSTGSDFPALRDEVGRAGGYFKPILGVIWTDWADEQRDYVRRILKSMSRPDARVRASFPDNLIESFLAFIEAKNLHSLYWRFESIHRHAFNGNEYSLEGIKADVQGIAVVLEHITAALGATRPQLRDKFKELWASDSAVLNGLKTNSVMKVGGGRGIDMAWHAAQQGHGRVRSICADLAISYAIRGGAHRIIQEANPLVLEHMSLILLRAAVETFRVVMTERAKVAA